MSRRAFAAFGLVVALAVPASSWALTFTGSYFFSGSAFSEPGLKVKSTATGPANAKSFALGLESGESKKGKIATIWTDETWVNSDDKVPQDIALNVQLTSPFSDSGQVAGNTAGKSILFGLLQYGKLSFDNEPLTFTDDRFGTLTVALYGGKFNMGLLGLCGVKCNGLDVHAKVTYDAPPAPVPLPASLVLLMSAVGAVGLFGRRVASQTDAGSTSLA